MNFKKAPALILILGLFSINVASAQNEKTPSLGGVAKDVKKEMTELSSEMEQFSELATKCIQEKDEEKATSCMVNGLNKLSEGGSYVAQHALGNYYEVKGEKDKAIEFYNKALNNPNINEEYKIEVQKDFDRVKK